MLALVLLTSSRKTVLAYHLSFLVHLQCQMIQCMVEAVVLETQKLFWECSSLGQAPLEIELASNDFLNLFGRIVLSIP